MITKKDLKAYNYKTIEEFYNYIVESLTNGQFSQVKTLIKQLSEKQYVYFLTYLNLNKIPIENIYIEGRSK